MSSPSRAHPWPLDHDAGHTACEHAKSSFVSDDLDAYCLMNAKDGDRRAILGVIGKPARRFVGAVALPEAEKVASRRGVHGIRGDPSVAIAAADAIPTRPECGRRARGRSPGSRGGLAGTSVRRGSAAGSEAAYYRAYVERPLASTEA